MLPYEKYRLLLFLSLSLALFQFLYLFLFSPVFLLPAETKSCCWSIPCEKRSLQDCSSCFLPVLRQERIFPTAGAVDRVIGTWPFFCGEEWAGGCWRGGQEGPGGCPIWRQAAGDSLVMPPELGLSFGTTAGQAWRRRAVLHINIVIGSEQREMCQVKTGARRTKEAKQTK